MQTVWITLLYCIYAFGFSPVKQWFAIHGCFHCVNIFPAECFLLVVFFHFQTDKKKGNTPDIVLHNASYTIKANIWGITFIFFCFRLRVLCCNNTNVFALGGRFGTFSVNLTDFWQLCLLKLQLCRHIIFFCRAQMRSGCSDILFHLWGAAGSNCISGHI